jgi:hypothetical protein
MAKSRRDYIPDNDAKYDTFLLNILHYVQDQTVGANPRWTHIPADEITALNDAYNRWFLAYTQVKGPHTSPQVDRKNEIKKETKKQLRTFINAFLRYHPAVTNYDKEQMGIPIHDDTRTGIPPHVTPPVIVSVTSLPGFGSKIRYQDVDVPGSRARPYGCNGCLLLFAIADGKITDHKLLTQSVLMTRNPYTLRIGDTSTEGKYLSCCAVWQNETGERGDPSEIHHMLIID